MLLQLWLGVALFLILPVHNGWGMGALLASVTADEHSQVELAVVANFLPGNPAYLSTDGSLPAQVIPIGMGVLVVGLGVGAAWWTRRRIIHSKHYTERVCPKCGGKITRIRRKQRHRIAEKLLFVPIRRYACTDSTCGWVGVRFGTSGESEWRVRQR